ncbi:GNAT family N-acetyltransferase [Bacteroides heparinolyticus]|uniref:GNAT family N-acetyltransferase n=1 Tax=Prevotella heparinolytica TaxID=28113 RepID=UPI00359F7382
MNSEEYLNDPCGASSLPFWKTKKVIIPEHIAVLREDLFCIADCDGIDEPYFKLMHNLKQIRQPKLITQFELIPCETLDFANHINECYAEESISLDELCAYYLRPVFDPNLWIAVRDATSNRIVATGIAELDSCIGEGILEWIQVSPDYRRRGLGKFLVSELLCRMKDKAKFVTVSGRMNNPDNPLALYLSCGFANPVIWHVVTK